jgi:hypothetical protein
VKINKDRDDASTKRNDFSFSSVTNIVNISADDDSLTPFLSAMHFAYMFFGK